MAGNTIGHFPYSPALAPRNREREWPDGSTSEPERSAMMLRERQLDREREGDRERASERESELYLQRARFYDRTRSCPCHDPSHPVPTRPGPGLRMSMRGHSANAFRKQSATGKSQQTFMISNSWKKRSKTRKKIKGKNSERKKETK